MTGITLSATSGSGTRHPLRGLRWRRPTEHHHGLPHQITRFRKTPWKVSVHVKSGIWTKIRHIGKIGRCAVRRQTSRLRLGLRIIALIVELVVLFAFLSFAVSTLVFTLARHVDRLNFRIGVASFILELVFGTIILSLVFLLRFLAVGLITVASSLTTFSSAATPLSASLRGRWAALRPRRSTCPRRSAPST